MNRNSKGFTLAEMLTSMVVMAIISLAAVSLTMALTVAQESSEDFYRHVQIARNSLRRIERNINKAKLITAADSNTLVYWADDANENGAVELTELRMITTDLATGEVMLCYAEFPAFWPASWKTQWDERMTVDMAADLSTAAGWIKNDQWFKQDALATEITSLKFSLSPTAPTSEVLQIEMTVGEGPGSVQLRSSASLRASKVADLYVDEGDYFLAAPE